MLWHSRETFDLPTPDEFGLTFPTSRVLTPYIDAVTIES